MRSNALKYTPEQMAELWERNGRNMYKTAKELDVSITAVRYRLMLAGVHVPKSAAEPKTIIHTETTEVIDGMTNQTIKDKFKLEEGCNVWVLDTKGKPILRRIEKINRHNIETKNRFGRVECFTYGDILTGHHEKCRREGKK